MDHLGTPTDDELLAYLDETLGDQRAVAIERLLRDDPEIRERAALLIRHRDRGGHSIGEIWRRQRLSCPTRSQLGSMVLGVAPPELQEYIQFHVNVISCRFCQANLADLKESQTTDQTGKLSRQRRYFESSAGILRAREVE